MALQDENGNNLDLPLRKDDSSWIENSVQRNQMYHYVQGLVHGYTNERKEFTAKNFVGKSNFDWKNTPIMPIYQHEYDEMIKTNPKNKAVELAKKRAGMAFGYLLKKVLISDKHAYKRLPKTNPDETWSYRRLD